MSPLMDGMSNRRLDHYRSSEGSRHHRDKYRGWGKFFTHRAECAILHRLLARAGRSEEILDAPCGAGRFLPVTAQFTDKVCLADLSPQMLDVAREQFGDRAFSYTSLDLRDLPESCPTYEGVVSLRLTHHIYDEDVLEAYFANLSRLARRWIIVTFRDAHAPRTVVRRTIRSLSGRGLPAQTLDRVAASMATHGLYLAGDGHVSRWFSGHRYALFIRNRES